MGTYRYPYERLASLPAQPSARAAGMRDPPKPYSPEFSTTLLPFCPQVRELVAQCNSLGAGLEDLTDENAALRHKAGLPPGANVDAAGVRLAREVALAQLRSVNALLERQVGGRESRARCCQLYTDSSEVTMHFHVLCCLQACLDPDNGCCFLHPCGLGRPQVSDLEEERRKLRLELKYRAKYHGR